MLFSAHENGTTEEYQRAAACVDARCGALGGGVASGNAGKMSRQCRTLICRLEVTAARAFD